ncbi:MAG: hypothetical protein KC776_37230 [Myxococcales bacterium]|nr:hypothetical protein [Myxococcales bacterium]
MRPLLNGGTLGGLRMPRASDKAPRFARWLLGMLGAFLVFLVPLSALLLCVRSSPETNMHRVPMVLGAGLIFLVFAASAWVARGVLRTTIGTAVATDTALPRRDAKPATATLVATVLALIAAVVTSILGWSSAAFAAWTTALPPQVDRTLTLQQAREQYHHGMTIFRLSGIVALLLCIVLPYLVWRRFKSSADAASAPDVTPISLE